MARRARFAYIGGGRFVLINQLAAIAETVFRACTDALGGDVDLDAFARYVGARSPVSPPVLNRITKLG